MGAGGKKFEMLDRFADEWEKHECHGTCPVCGVYIAAMRTALDVWRPDVTPPVARHPSRPIDELIAASSLGTPEAVAIRAKTPPDVVARVVARSEQLCRLAEWEHAIGYGEPPADARSEHAVAANAVLRRFGDARVRFLAMDGPDAGHSLLRLRTLYVADGSTHVTVPIDDVWRHAPVPERALEEHARMSRTWVELKLKQARASLPAPEPDASNVGEPTDSQVESLLRHILLTPCGCGHTRSQHAEDGAFDRCTRCGCCDYAPIITDEDAAAEVAPTLPWENVSAPGELTAVLEGQLEAGAIPWFEIRWRLGGDDYGLRFDRDPRKFSGMTGLKTTPGADGEKNQKENKAMGDNPKTTIGVDAIRRLSALAERLDQGNRRHDPEVVLKPHDGSLVQATLNGGGLWAAGATADAAIAALIAKYERVLRDRVRDDVAMVGYHQTEPADPGEPDGPAEFREP